MERLGFFLSAASLLGPEGLAMVSPPEPFKNSLSLLCGFLWTQAYWLSKLDVLGIYLSGGSWAPDVGSKSFTPQGVGVVNSFHVVCHHAGGGVYGEFVS